MAKKPKSRENKKPKSREKKRDSDSDKIHVCSLPKVPPRPLAPGIGPVRERLIRANEKKWANGTTLRYYFFDRPSDGENGSWIGPESQKGVVRDAFQEWKDLDIGLEFRETPDREEAEIRIGFMQGDGSWSYVGRDVVDVEKDPDSRTMNFGWDLTTPYGRDTARHEIGHTLGFYHEHQNPYSGIEWNEAAVYDYFRGPPNNWDDDSIRWNILRKISPGEVGGSTWDPNSIMHYWFDAGLISKPVEYSGGLTPEPGLSEKDIEWVRKFYPHLDTATEPELKPYESQRLAIEPGQQVNFWIRPSYSRTYRIQTFGRSDTVMALFEQRNGGPRYLAGDDDSGFDRNARIDFRLHRGSEYILRVRLYFSQMSGDTAVFMW